MCNKPADDVRASRMFTCLKELLQAKTDLRNTAVKLSQTTRLGAARRTLRYYMVKLCDFGSAFIGPAPVVGGPAPSPSSLRGRSARGSSKYACPQVVFLHLAASSPAEHKATWGTPGAPIPEVAEEGYDPFAADVWSYGITLFVLSVGKHPFRTASPSDSNFRAFVRATQPEVLVECDAILAPNCNAWKEDAARHGGAPPPWIWPRCMSPALRHLVASCLKVRTAERCNIQYVVEHQWFINPQWHPTTPPAAAPVTASSSNISSFGMPSATAQREPTGASAASGSSAPYMGSAASAGGMALSEAGMSMCQPSPVRQRVHTGEDTGGSPHTPTHFARSRTSTNASPLTVDAHPLGGSVGGFHQSGVKLVSTSPMNATVLGEGGIAIRNPRVSSASASDGAAAAARVQLRAEESMQGGAASNALSPPASRVPFGHVHSVKALGSSSEGRMHVPSALYFVGQSDEIPLSPAPQAPAGARARRPHAASVHHAGTAHSPLDSSPQARSHTGLPGGATARSSFRRPRAASGTVAVQSIGTGLSVPYPEPGAEYGTHTNSVSDSQSERRSSSASVAGHDATFFSSDALAVHAAEAGSSRRSSGIAVGAAPPAAAFTEQQWVIGAASEGSHHLPVSDSNRHGNSAPGSPSARSAALRGIPRSGTMGGEIQRTNERLLPPLLGGGSRVVTGGGLQNPPASVRPHGGGGADDSDHGLASTTLGSSSDGAFTPQLPLVGGGRGGVTVSPEDAGSPGAGPLRPVSPHSIHARAGLHTLETHVACASATVSPPVRLGPAAAQ